jgi:hypothetical protein
MHHLDPEEVSSLYNIEETFYEKYCARTLVIKDICSEFMAPRLVDRREDWDNLSDLVFYHDPERRPADPAGHEPRINPWN